MERLLAPVDWERVLLPQTPLLEIVIRGSVMYLALYLILLIVRKRERGALGVADLLVIVLIADAAQNGMSGDYVSIADGLILVAVIIGWSAALDWLGFKIPRVQRFLHPGPLLLVRRGRMIHRNMAKETVTEDELRSRLRTQGVFNLEDAEEVYMEGDGQISVRTRDDADPPSSGNKNGPPVP